MYFADNTIILTRRVFREDDLIISAYSEEHGKIVAVARGAKKILSKLAGHLEPVSLVYLNLAKGKNIHKLIGAANIKSYNFIKKDLEKTQLAGRFLGLVEKLVLEGHSDKRIFVLLEKYLGWLENSKTVVRSSLLTGALMHCASSQETGGNARTVVDKFNNQAQDDSNYELAELAAGFKLLHYLGLNPALKTEFKSEIDFIIKNNLQEIAKNQAILKSFNILKKIINKEIKIITN